jgi:hypothetical protein
MSTKITMPTYMLKEQLRVLRHVALYQALVSVDSVTTALLSSFILEKPSKVSYMVLLLRVPKHVTAVIMCSETVQISKHSSSECHEPFPVAKSAGIYYRCATIR